MGLLYSIFNITMSLLPVLSFRVIPGVCVGGWEGGVNRYQNLSGVGSEKSECVCRGEAYLINIC